MKLSADMPGVALHTFVRLNGEDISGVCREADDVEGYAECCVTNAEGHIFAAAEGEGPVTEIRRGVVEFSFSSDEARERITRLYGGAE